MTFTSALQTEFAKLGSGTIDRAASKRAMIEAYKKAPPSAAEKEDFLQKQTPEGKTIFLEAEREAKLVTVMPRDKRNMLGLGAGAGIMMLLGAPVIIPLALAGGAGYYLLKTRKGCMTPDRQRIYEAALKDLKDPVKLKILADEFQKEGCTKEADLLRKRANLQELPKETQVARRKVFKAAIKSDNVQAVEKIAVAFEGEGCTGAAECLRVHAAALRSL